ncbi:hypothetical protein [Pseudolactococcus insecticola]|uniref:Uncharacterized protein n=1 Tax=Pseudolactococcus insecticola TaxID=2709158 RepID=A0A6A0B7T3_9LACT|nr:hypothetical protein [Lactococcus insecticola]GFH40966.1 hypothetical protein Hs20B_13640 [Lactococcus insecticola]
MTVSPFEVKKSRQKKRLPAVNQPLILENKKRSPKKVYVLAIIFFVGLAFTVIADKDYGQIEKFGMLVWFVLSFFAYATVVTSFAVIWQRLLRPSPKTKNAFFIFITAFISNLLSKLMIIFYLFAFLLAPAFWLISKHWTIG